VTRHVGESLLGIRLQLEQEHLGGVGIPPHKREGGIYRWRLAGELWA
jgi:hypothetical protein